MASQILRSPDNQEPGTTHGGIEDHEGNWTFVNVRLEGGNKYPATLTIGKRGEEWKDCDDGVDKICLERGAASWF